MQQPIIEIILAIFTSVLMSSGLWAYVMRKADRKDAKTELIIGIGHDRILWLGMKYIERGWITQDEYENLYEYLYEPYLKLGGNGSAKKVISEVEKLPIKSSNLEGILHENVK